MFYPATLKSIPARKQNKLKIFLAEIWLSRIKMTHKTEVIDALPILSTFFFNFTE